MQNAYRSDWPGGQSVRADGGGAWIRLKGMEILYGLHPVEEALKAGKRRFDHVCVAREREDLRLQRIDGSVPRGGGKRAGRAARSPDASGEDGCAPGRGGDCAGETFADLEDLLEPAGPVSAGAGWVEDPQNLGALLRTADGAGVDGRGPDGAAVCSAEPGGDQGFGRRGGACGDCAGGEPGAGAGRGEEAEYLVPGAGRARHDGLRRVRLHAGVRAGAGERRQRAARAGAQDVRPPDADSDGGGGVVAECFSGGRGGVV